MPRVLRLEELLDDELGQMDQASDVQREHDVDVVWVDVADSLGTADAACIVDCGVSR